MFLTGRVFLFSPRWENFATPVLEGASGRWATFGVMTSEGATLIPTVSGRGRSELRGVTGIWDFLTCRARRKLAAGFQRSAWATQTANMSEEAASSQVRFLFDHHHVWAHSFTSACVTQCRRADWLLSGCDCQGRFGLGSRLSLVEDRYVRC